MKWGEYLRNIFFSWQSDLDNHNHRNFIEKCIVKAIKKLEKNLEIRVYMDYDRDTLGLSGSPDIVNSIFEKIEKSALFIGDISNIATSENNKKIPNPNVLIELGYAAKVLGWDKVICIYDIQTGPVESLPFDLRQKRILIYDPLNECEVERVSSILCENIKALFSSGKLWNPLGDYMKGKIDKEFLDICKGLSNIMFETISMADGLSHTTKFLKMSIDDIEVNLNKVSFPGFLILNTYEDTDAKLRGILRDLFSSNYFSREWAITVIELIDWLRIYRNLFSPREAKAFLEFTCNSCSDKYNIISGHSTCQINPINSQIVIETINKTTTSKNQCHINPNRPLVGAIVNYNHLDAIDGHEKNNRNGYGAKYNNLGRIVNITDYPYVYISYLLKICEIKKDKVKQISKLFYDFSALCSKWLEYTDSEFILDPDYYITN